MKPFLIILILLVSQSCIKTVNVDLPEEEPKQVVGCLFSADKTIKLNLTSSVGILEDFSTPIHGAHILLYENEILKDTLIFTGEYYKSKIVANANKTYKIISKATGFKDVKAQNTIPSPLSISDFSLDPQAFFNSDYDNYYGRMQMTIHDNANEKNYYELVIKRKYYSINNEEEQYIISKAWIEDCSNSFIRNEIEDQSWPTALVFSDDSFQGETISFFVDFPNPYYEDDTPQNYDIILRNVTKDYYLYRKRLNKHTEFKGGDIIWDVMIEPIQMYNNIENGFGIFAGYNEYCTTINH